mmetsp:Transcript_32798/g.57106  ORF Transcript_32798/g.57106 Transcript_32798/m.57106 type:complete len:247 (-) Transcript_32798:1926-2666(-)
MSKRPKTDEETKQVPSDFASWISPIDSSWKDVLGPFLNGSRMQRLHDFVANAYRSNTCRPPIDEIFTAFRLTPFNRVKVVVVGQDPYPGPTEAMGLSFSVHRGVKVPGSLRNIYKCLQQDPDVEFTVPKHGDLSAWAERGVFMLNAVLTVTQGKPNSHINQGWEDFTDAVIEALNSQSTNLVFLLWGSFAQRKAAGVNRSLHHVLEACHPSPLSASKGGFFTCKHFSKTNEYLRSVGSEPIDWNLS